MSVESLKVPFRSLSVPNYRRYFIGQIVSLSGNWMQIVAEMWLILKLTNSSFAVGLTAALQFVPMLFAGAWGGLLADRLPKRELLMLTQTLMAIPALTLWILTGTGSVTAPVVLALVFARGAVNAIDNPARQSFVMEMVGRIKVVNAVSLNSLIVQSARIIGPAFAGTIIATVGVAPCFLINALSFGAMLIALRLINPAELHAGERVTRQKGQLREAVRHVADTPALRVPLIAMALVGTLSFNFQVILPLMARFAFHGTAATYAALTSAMALGAVSGALAAGTRETIKPAQIAGAGLAFGIFSIAAAAAPTLGLEVIALAVTGAASVTFAASINSTLQLSAAPAMRGRVMALYSVVFLGSTPIGAPITGWLAGAAGPRSTLVLAGIAALVGAFGLWWALLRRPTLEAEDAADRVETRDQPVHVRRRVVHREGRTRRSRDSQLPHERLRAMMSRADTDARPSENLADIVRMRALDGEGHERPAIDGIPGTVNRDAGHLSEPRERIGDERLLVNPDLLDADRPDPVDRGAKSDRLGDL
jgi:MFS family permease